MKRIANIGKSVITLQSTREIIIIVEEIPTPIQILGEVPPETFPETNPGKSQTANAYYTQQTRDVDQILV